MVLRLEDRNPLFLRPTRARGGVGADSRKEGITDHTKTADLQFEAEPERLKIDFERHGEVKSWFDMISRRVIVFVTFVRIRLFSISFFSYHLS